MSAAPSFTVADIFTGQKLGALVRIEESHFVYQDKKGRFGLARRDRSDLLPGAKAA